MLISETYRRLNTELHGRSLPFGSRGNKWSAMARHVADQYGCDTVLDYGCGKTTIAVHGRPVVGYDPAIQQWSARPEPADLVVCTDVLEHVEPELIDNVLADIKDLSKKSVFLLVATRPSDKFLSDGRNCHLLVRDMGWWIGKLEGFFHIELGLDSGEREFWTHRADAFRHGEFRTSYLRPGREFWIMGAPL